MWYTVCAVDTHVAWYECTYMWCYAYKWLAVPRVVHALLITAAQVLLPTEAQVFQHSLQLLWQQCRCTPGERGPHCTRGGWELRAAVQGAGPRCAGGPGAAGRMHADGMGPSSQQGNPVRASVLGGETGTGDACKCWDGGVPVSCVTKVHAFMHVCNFLRILLSGCLNGQHGWWWMWMWMECECVCSCMWCVCVGVGVCGVWGVWVVWVDVFCSW